MISTSALRMIGLAILGILVAAAVAVVASQLASRQIGLASEPVSAGDELAPPVAKPHRDGPNAAKDRGETEEGDSTTPTGEMPNPPATINGEAPAATTETTSPGDDASKPGGGESGGEDGGGGGDSKGDD